MQETKTCGCGRPTQPGSEPMCKLHRALWDADAELEEHTHALQFLDPFMQMVELFGNLTLTEAMAAAREEIRTGEEEATQLVRRAQEAFGE